MAHTAVSWYLPDFILLFLYSSARVAYMQRSFNKIIQHPTKTREIYTLQSAPNFLIQYFSRVNFRINWYTMILGVGIDIIEVRRVAEKIAKGAGFRELVFSKNEIGYCETKTKKFEHYAARFAAKEAFFKAIGTGWAEGTSFNEIEVTHNEAGRPGIVLLGETQKKLSSFGAIKISISLSHIKAIASAVVIIEKQP